MPDYSKSKIYKIVCNITGLIYIGSTTQTLIQRLQDHKFNYKYYLNGKTNFTSSFKIIENDNYDIILIEDVSCERKEQLHARERYWIENIECVNKQIPTRTRKEYLEDNKERIKEYRQNNKEKLKELDKKYRENNKEKLKEKRKEYIENNKEKIKEKRKEYIEKNKEQIKEQIKGYRKKYYEDNKEIIKEKVKSYREKNKEKIKNNMLL